MATSESQDNQLLTSGLILAILFTILGISQVVALISSSTFRTLDIIPISIPEGPAISLLATMIRNTVGVVIMLVLIGKQIIPSISPVDEEGYELVEKPGSWTVKWYFLLIAVLYGILILMQLIIQQIRPDTDTTSVYDQFLDNITIQIGFFLVAVVFAPIFEELLFRRFLMSSLQSSGFHHTYVVTFSALVFGFSHTLGDLTGGSIYTAILHLVSTTSIGLVLGIVYLKTQNIIYPILFHAINNAFSSGLSLLGLAVESNPLLVSAILVFIFLGLIVILIIAIVKFLKHRSLIRERTGRFLSELWFLDKISKVVLLIGTITGFTILPLIIIYISSVFSISTQITLGIYWSIIALVSVIYYSRHS